VTLSFVFLVSLLVGLVMAATSGLLQRMAAHRVGHKVTVPSPEHLSAVINLIARRAGLPLAAFGVAGLLLRRSEVQSRVAWSVAAALAAGLVGMVLHRTRPSQAPVGRAVVVREIPATGFGQVEIEQQGRTVVLAARSVDRTVIPVGSPIEMVDCESSVLTVRRVRVGATPA
jgi:hypothetical protein